MKYCQVALKKFIRTILISLLKKVNNNKARVIRMFILEITFIPLLTPFQAEYRAREEISVVNNKVAYSPLFAENTWFIPPFI